MGRFVNPENSAFQVALNSEIYNEEIRSEFGTCQCLKLYEGGKIVVYQLSVS